MPMLDIDKLIVNFDRALRTLCAGATSVRPLPGGELPESNLDDSDKRKSSALMRVNHAGEICAQALYQGQALTARNRDVQQVLESAAIEETEHLAWTRQRIAELDGKRKRAEPNALCKFFYDWGSMWTARRQVESRLSCRNRGTGGAASPKAS